MTKSIFYAIIVTMKRTLVVIFLVCLAIAFNSCRPKETSAKGQIPDQTQQGQFGQISQEEADIFVAEFLFDKTTAVKDRGQISFGESTSFEITKAMKAGWNLGNTFDATGAIGMPSELSWGQPYTEEEMIDGLAASGIKTLRIPVSWHNHIIDKRTYQISPEWMERVRTVVNWALQNDMYVIINSHHDNYEKESKMLPASGYYPNATNLVESQRFLYMNRALPEQTANGGIAAIHVVLMQLNVLTS